MDMRQFFYNHQIKFGTSGIRAKNTSLTDEVCYTCTVAFLRYLEQSKLISPNGVIAIAGDLRVNTDRIIRVVWQALIDNNYIGVYLGKIPTPALGYYCGQKKCAGIMITGSHIEAYMNGIKFYLDRGEILKQDEQKILAQSALTERNLFSSDGALKNIASPMPTESPEGRQQYVQRYLNFFLPQSLKDLRIGVYVHSSVSSSILIELVESLGATVIPFGQANEFHSLDTEALTEHDLAIAKEKIGDLNLNAIISTDGDGDRSLISDENGNWLRGDVVGMLCAIILQADYVVIPMTCNSSIDRAPGFKQIIRTRVGSPYVIAGMNRLLDQGKSRIVGYEANGGLLLGTRFKRGRHMLSALPTRDGSLPLLCLLTYIKEKNITLSALNERYQYSFTVSSSLKDFPWERLDWFDNDHKNQAEIAQDIQRFFHQFSALNHIDYTDGVRVSLKNGDIIHLRPSGNSPELRCYTESDTQERAQILNEECRKLLYQWSEQNAEAV